MTTKDFQKRNGLSIKWVVNLEDKDRFFPGKRTHYAIALRSVNLQGEDLDTLVHICTAPQVNVMTFLPNRSSISALRSCVVRGNKLLKDFSESMDFFNIDLTSSNINVNIADMNGKEMTNVKGSLIFDVIELI